MSCYEFRRQAVAVPRARKFKGRLYFAALTLCLLLCVKFIWFFLMAPSASSQGASDTKADIAARRAYLVQRVANERFGTADMPSVVASPYREELAIATLSMTTVALTSLSFADPSDRVTNRDAVRVMLSRVPSTEIRRYDVIWWGEDAIESLPGAKGHVGYLGHLNLMLGCYFLLGGKDEEWDLHLSIWACAREAGTSSAGMAARSSKISKGEAALAKSSVVMTSAARVSRAEIYPPFWTSLLVLFFYTVTPQYCFVQ